MIQNHKRTRKGFTLLEILLVIAAIGILAAIVLVAINPNRQIAQARNAQRRSDVNTIYKALEQYLIDNGRYPNSISTTPRYICNTGVEQVGGSTNCTDRADLRELVPTYIAGIPKDPQATGANTGYNVVINPNNNKVGVSADLSENRLISINPYVINNGLVLHLDAGNAASYPGTGTTWFDLSGNNNVTLVNGVGYNSANLGSLVFDGVDDFINLGSSYFISTSNPFTINLWMSVNPKPKVGTQADFHRMITLRSSGTSTLGIAYVNQLNSGYEGLYIANNNGWVKAKTSFYPTPNLWGMLTITYMGSGSTNISNFNMYWNNSPLVFNTNGLNTPAITTDNNYLGVRQSGDIQAYRGNISSLQIYNRVLSLSEIQHNFNAARGRFGL